MSPLRKRRRRLKRRARPRGVLQEPQLLKDIIDTGSDKAYDAIEDLLDGATVEAEYKVKFGCVTQESMAGFIAAETKIHTKDGREINMDIPVKFGAHCKNPGMLRSAVRYEDICCECKDLPEKATDFNPKEYQ